MAPSRGGPASSAIGLLVLAVVGCGRDPESGTTVPTTPVDTAAELEPLACATPAPEQWDTLPLDWPGEEFAFDAAGRLVTAVDWAGAVWAMDRSGGWTLVAPFASDEVAGVDFDLDGNLLIGDEANGRIARLGVGGTTTVLAGSLSSPNSIAVHPDGFAVVTAFDRLLRMDVTTGATEELAAIPGQDLDGVAFTPDGSAVWFNADEVGNVYRLPLTGVAAGGEPDLMEHLDVASFVGELDGAAVDACGNLYVVRTDGRVSRIRADGVVEPRFVNLRGEYVSAAHFGSGVGGWERDHLYVMDRYGALHDLPIGIAGAPEPHLPAP